MFYGGEFFMVMISQIFLFFWCTTRAFIYISGLLRFIASSRDEKKT